MIDIFKLINTNKNTFKDFEQWLFISLGKNVNSFKNFAKYPNKLKIPYLIEYLEHKGVNVLETLPYYHYKGSSHNMTFVTLLTYVIREEFKRIETNKIINYIPF